MSNNPIRTRWGKASAGKQALVLMAACLAPLVAAAPEGDSRVGTSGERLSRAAPSGKGSQDAQVAAILAVSGIETSLRQFAARLVDEGVQPAMQGRTEPKEIESVRQVFREAYPADGFVSAVSGALKKEHNEARYRNIKAILTTPLARKMIEFEIRVPSMKDMQAFGMQMEKKPLSKERVQLLRELDALMGSGEFHASNQMASMRMMALAGIEGCSDRKAAFEKDFSRQRRSLHQAIRESFVMMTAFVYREASDEEIKDYVRLSGKPDIRWLQGVVTASLDAEMAKGRQRLGRHFQQLAVLRESQESMFAPKCAGEPESPKAQKTAEAPWATRASVPSRANSDARSCLDHEESLMVRACAEEYR